MKYAVLKLHHQLHCHLLVFLYRRLAMLLHLHMIHLNTQLLHAPQQHNIQDSGTNTHQCEDKNEAKNMENSDLLPPSLALTIAAIIIIIVLGGSFIYIVVTSW